MGIFDIFKGGGNKGAGDKANNTGQQTANQTGDVVSAAKKEREKRRVGQDVDAKLEGLSRVVEDQEYEGNRADAQFNVWARSMDERYRDINLTHAQLTASALRNSGVTRVPIKQVYEAVRRVEGQVT